MAKIACIRCGRCCRRWPLTIDLKEFENSNTEDFYKGLIERQVKGIKLGNVTKVEFILHVMCKNYNPETRQCNIYKDRPSRCKEYFCNEYGKK